MIKAQQSWVKHCDTPKYKEGDLVWLEGKNLRVNQPTAKLAPRRHGPFKITQVMSAVNYRLELPTQWSIHPVFHIDLLTPYKETIMHGPNFTRPTPELIDGEEEYSVEKILDSRHFGRRRRLQYLVKWEGYPDAENMWVDKDDVFADDKVREFKISNPDTATHIRGTSFTKSPHSSPPTRSQYLYQHALSYMSSDSNDDLTYEYPAGAIADSPIPFSQELSVDTPVHAPVPISIVDFTTLQPLSPAAPTFVPRPVTVSSSVSDVAAMFRQLWVHTPAPLTPDGQWVADQAAETFALSFTPAEGQRSQASPGLEQGATTGLEAAVGATPTTPHRRRSDSNGSATAQDLRQCTRCGEQNQYCHGHTPIIPNASLDLPPRLPLQASVQPDGVARINLNCALATVLASRLINALKNTKMPLRFRHPSTTEKKSRTSSRRASESSKPSLPKGWVYVPEEVEVKVEAKVIDPSQYQMLDTPCRSKHKALGPPEESHPQSRQASNTIEALPSYHSVSGTSMAVKHLRVTSTPTSMPLTLL
jgi:hypothetical protein